MGCYWNSGQCAGRGESSPVHSPRTGGQQQAALTELCLSPRMGRPRLCPYRGPQPHTLPCPSLKKNSHHVPLELTGGFPGTTRAHMRLFQKAKPQPVLGKGPRTLENAQSCLEMTLAPASTTLF